jgi:hypothetical protein
MRRLSSSGVCDNPLLKMLADRTGQRAEKIEPNRIFLKKTMIGFKESENTTDNLYIY